MALKIGGNAVFAWSNTQSTDALLVAPYPMLVESLFAKSNIEGYMNNKLNPAAHRLDFSEGADHEARTWPAQSHKPQSASLQQALRTCVLTTRKPP